MYTPSAYQELARQHHAEVLREARLDHLAAAESRRSRARLVARVRAVFARRAPEPAPRPAVRPS